MAEDKSFKVDLEALQEKLWDSDFDYEEKYLFGRLIGWVPEQSDRAGYMEEQFIEVVSSLTKGREFSTAYKGRGKPGRPKGYHHTEETRKKLSDMKKGTPSAIAWGKMVRAAKAKKKGPRQDEEVGDSDV